jgi:DNA invertase Pin-like site-specific DNA recombinase
MSSKHSAFAYLRVSGLGQVDGDGFRRQADAIGRFAKAAGFEIVREFREPGVSGTSDLDARPALMEALSAIASNGVRIIIVEHADRIARDLLVQESIIRQFKILGARLLTADAVDLTDDAEPSRVLVRQMLGAIAQHDKQRLVLKLRASRTAQRHARGYCEGRIPYGWKDAQERGTLDRMRSLRRKPIKGDRRSYAAVAAALNADGCLNRERRPWSASRVHAVLKQAAMIEQRIGTETRNPRKRS